MKNAMCEVRLEGKGLVYQPAGGKAVVLGWPAFEVNDKRTKTTGLQWTLMEERALANGCVEYRHQAPLAKGLSLACRVRIAPDSPIVRFRYELAASAEMKLSKAQGTDALTYGTLSLAKCPAVTEVRLSEWVEVDHSFELNEVPVKEKEFAQSQQVMGPILVGEGKGQSLLLAYEHGSTYPDAFIAYALSPDRTASVRAVHGNYCAGQAAEGFATVWFLLGAVDGTKEDLASAMRHFLLRRQAVHAASRAPHIFYNTWNYQERKKNWYGTPYLDEMHQERMLKEIDAAHEMGIDVFVIDTGWFTRTGDWRANTMRFPDELKSVKERLQRYGMKLGLWFDNSAGVESDVGKAHADCRCSSGGKVWDPHVIWETEPAHRMCLVSRYWEAFAAELIRLHREVGVSYFKWDAIGQYGCDDPGHLHGTAENAPQERGQAYAFALPLYMAKIVEKVQEACPEAIVDFDVTETHRAVGLAFLSAGKFFLINNGPYCWNYNVPKKDGWPNGNPNLFFFPGPARTWICRQALTYDKWVPMNLFLTHYLPDDGEQNQVNCVASLILGQNGIWGDLPAISPEGRGRFAKLLGMYKRVREDIAAAPPVRQGMIGGNPEVHEKINPASGRGAVVVFTTNRGTYTYITERKVDGHVWASDGVQVEQLASGQAKITVTITGQMSWEGDPETMQWAKIVYFGVQEIGSTNEHE